MRNSPVAFGRAGRYRLVMDEQLTDPSIDPRPGGADVFVDVAADPERVWEALTTEAGLAPWMGEGSTVDAVPGGLVALPDPVGGVTRRGRVERVDDGQRLDFTWWPALRPAERTSVSITVSPADSGCRVRVTERPLGARASINRLPVGLWSWRLAVLSLSCCLSRI